MNAVGNTFHSHIIHQIYAFHCAGVLKFTLVVHVGHCVVEVGSVAVANLVSCFHFRIAGCGVADSGKHALFHKVATHFKSSWKFGSHVPASHALVVFYDMAIFLWVRVANNVRHLCTSLLQVEVRAFKVQTHDWATWFAQQSITSFASVLNHLQGR